MKNLLIEYYSSIAIEADETQTLKGRTDIFSWVFGEQIKSRFSHCGQWRRE